jgi:uncharacterized protein (TIGR00730 family)
MSIHAVAVFCGSKSGNNPLFEKHAAELGKLIATQGLLLIYGGGNKGIMGSVANAVLQHNGKATGVIPKILIEWEQQHHGLTELVISENMHQRKKLMYELCDAAIILPGGFGTLDEFFEMLTWNQLNIHNKKIYVLNSGGFYSRLIEHIYFLQQQGFLYENVDTRITICNTPGEIMEKMFAQIDVSAKKDSP